MTCEELLKALNEYVDGTLDMTAVDCQRFAAHLADCNPCQIVVDNIRGTISLFKLGEPFPLPTEFKSRLDQALRHRWQEKFGESA